MTPLHFTTYINCILILSCTHFGGLFTVTRTLMEIGKRIIHRVEEGRKVLVGEPIIREISKQSPSHTILKALALVICPPWIRGPCRCYAMNGLKRESASLWCISQNRASKRF